MGDWRLLTDRQLKIIIKKRTNELLLLWGVYLIINVMLLFCALIFSRVVDNKIPYIIYAIVALLIGVYVVVDCVKTHNQNTKQRAIALDVECVDKDCRYVDWERRSLRYFVSFIIDGQKIEVLAGEVFDRAQLGTKLTVIHFVKDGEQNTIIDADYIDGVYIAEDLL